MVIEVAGCLPRSRREIFQCVDEYETARRSGFPDLQEIAGHISPEYRSAALGELAGIDIEVRWEARQPKRVEQYLEEFPEILDDPAYPGELIAQEYHVRYECGEEPTVDEYCRRFPDSNVEQLIGSHETLTISFGTGTRPTNSRPLEAAPEAIGRYRVARELGSGAFGRVFLCHDPELKRDVAVKLLHATAAPSEPEAAELLHEAQGAARLQEHPGIVSVYDVGKLDDGRGYIVFEYVPGRTLRDRIRAGNYTRAQAVEWCAQIAEALCFAHENGVIHRDLSPANVLLDHQGRARLTDFGMAKVDNRFYCDESDRPLGNPGYMPPEQASGEAKWATERADIYSLGAILYELLAKRCPFPMDARSSVSDLLKKIRNDLPTPLREIDKTIPRKLERIRLKAMAKAPAGRYSTASDMASALRSRRRPRPLLVSVAAVVLAPVLVAILVWGSGVISRNGSKYTKKIDVPPPPPVADTLDLQMYLYREGYREWVDVLGPRGAWVTSIRDGDKLWFHGKLSPGEGYVYLIHYCLSGPEVLWPLPDDLRLPEKVVKFACPSESDDIVFEIEPEEMAATEMFLVGVADRPLSAEDLDHLLQLPFEPSGEVADLSDDQVVQIPVPLPRHSAAQSSRKLTYPTSDAFGESFAEALKQHFRIHRALVYRHEKP